MKIYNILQAYQLYRLFLIKKKKRKKKEEHSYNIGKLIILGFILKKRLKEKNYNNIIPIIYVTDIKYLEFLSILFNN